MVLVEWFQDNTWSIWLAMALILGAVEAATVDFVFIMLAGGAAAGAGAAALGLPLPIQAIVAAVVAMALIVVVRPIAKRRLTSGSHPSMGSAALVGADAVVIEEVTATDGRVKLAGDVWTARLAPGHLPIAVGTPVVVIVIEGATAVVAPASPNDVIR